MRRARCRPIAVTVCAARRGRRAARLPPADRAAARAAVRAAEDRSESTGACLQPRADSAARARAHVAAMDGVGSTARRSGPRRGPSHSRSCSAGRRMNSGAGSAAAATAATALALRAAPAPQAAASRAARGPAPEVGSVRAVDLLEGTTGLLPRCCRFTVGCGRGVRGERLFYGGLVRLFVESQDFEVLGAGRHCATLRRFRAAQGSPARQLGSMAWQRAAAVDAGEFSAPIFENCASACTFILAYNGEFWCVKKRSVQPNPFSAERG